MTLLLCILIGLVLGVFAARSRRRRRKAAMLGAPGVPMMGPQGPSNLGRFR